FVCSQACLPYLMKAENPHILTISPPLTHEAKWFKPHPPYSIAKYTMSLFTLALAAEFAEHGIAAVVQMHLGSGQFVHCRMEAMLHRGPLCPGALRRRPSHLTRNTCGGT